MEVCVAYNKSRGKWIPVTVIFMDNMPFVEKFLNAVKKKYRLDSQMCDVNVIGEIGNPMYVLFEYNMSSILPGRVSPLAVSKDVGVLTKFYEGLQSTTPYFVMPSLTFIVKTYEELATWMAMMK